MAIDTSKIVEGVDVNDTEMQLKTPTGIIEITENGTVDVTNYATANVNIALPTLQSPNIGLTEGTLTIFPNTNNGNFVTNYKIFNGSDFVASIQTTTIDLTEYFSQEGTYIIGVKASGNNFQDSNLSNTVELILPLPEPEVEGCILFKSDAPFTLKFKQTGWDGTVEYSVDNEEWLPYVDASTIINSGAANNIYLRGYENTTFENTGIQLSGLNIKCIGNIENLLNYTTVQSNEHPPMADLCFSSFFSACTQLIEPPKLPAITLSNGCYRGMFILTGLTKLPALPATTLPAYCYGNMFTNCSNIKISETQVDEYINSYRIPYAGESTNTLSTQTENMFANTGGTFNGSPELNKTYYTSNGIVGG